MQHTCVFIVTRGSHAAANSSHLLRGVQLPRPPGCSPFSQSLITGSGQEKPSRCEVKASGSPQRPLMFKYRQEQKQKMTQRILSQQFRADTLTPTLQTNTPFHLMWRGRETPVPADPRLPDCPVQLLSSPCSPVGPQAFATPSPHGCIGGLFLEARQLGFDFSDVGVCCANTSSLVPVFCQILAG